jgi:hypothetical protein
MRCAKGVEGARQTRALNCNYCWGHWAHATWTRSVHCTNKSKTNNLACCCL